MKLLDVEGFGNSFQPNRSKEFTQVALQNSGPQPQFCTSKKATVSSLAMSTRKYDVLLFAEHRLYPPELEPKHGWHVRMSTMNKGTFTCLSYNTNGRKTQNGTNTVKQALL